MLITIKEQTEMQVEVKTPAYFKTSYGTFYRVYEDHLITLNRMYFGLTKSSDMFFNSNISEAIKETPCAEADFMNAYNSLMSEINPLVNNATYATL